MKQEETKKLCDSIRKIVRETKVKSEDEHGSWVNYFHKLLKKR